MELLVGIESRTILFVFTIEELCCTMCACPLGQEFKQLKEFEEPKIGPGPDLKLFKPV